MNVRRLSLIYSTKEENSATDHTLQGSSASDKLPQSTNPTTDPNKSRVGNMKGKSGSAAGFQSNIIVVL